MTRNQVLRFSVVGAVGLIALAILMRQGFECCFPSPRQIIFEKENMTLRSEYASLNSELMEVESQLAELRDRDDLFYRSILSLEPVPSSIREAGTGGSERNTYLRNMREPAMVMNVSQKIEDISNRMKIQSSSLEKVYAKALSNKRFLACRPSINPLSSADPFWHSSGYGYRLDPFTHKRTAHHGIDMAGPCGLEIHATGDGKVVIASLHRYGYGKEVVVDHGFGYVTIYGHLQEILVKKGDELKRGEVVGTLGSSGRSTGPHLHYEVRKDGHTVNPMFFFYENLSPVEYSQLASHATQHELPYQPNAMSQK